MIKINTVHNIDCIEGLKQIADKEADLTITDPPYGIGLEYDTYQDTEENWFKLMENTLPQIIRTSKMAILPCCKIANLDWIYTKFPPNWLICWYKGSTGHRSYVGFNDWEPHLVYGKNDGVVSHDYFQTCSSPKMGTHGHPCAKPIEWAEWLVKHFSKEGDLVIDPFAGSGTTLVACKKLRRNFIGFEISSNYCKIAELRLKETNPVTKNFGGYFK